MLLLLGFLADANKLIEEDGGLLLGLDLVSVVLAQFSLHKVTHLRKFRLTLRLETLDEILHLEIVLLGDAQLVSQVVSGRLRTLHLLLHKAHFRVQLRQLMLSIVVVHLEIKLATVKLFPVPLIHGIVLSLSVRHSRLNALDLS